MSAALPQESRDDCWRRCHHSRVGTGDPTGHPRRTFHAGQRLRTQEQKQLIANLLAWRKPIEAEAIEVAGQRMVAAVQE